MNKILRIGFLALFSVILFLIEDYYLIGSIYFYLIIGVTTFDLVKRKSVELINVWNVSFLYIILSEVFSPLFSTNEFHLSAIQFLIVANNMINIGYYSFFKKNKEESKIPLKVLKERKTNLVPFILVSLVGLYFIFKIESALIAFTLGRISGGEGIDGNLFLNSILNAVGLVLPAIICYYYIVLKKTKILTPLMIASPIFVILFLGGTRFPLLFSVLAFIVVGQASLFGKMTFKKYVYISIVLAGLLMSSIVMKHFRAAAAEKGSFGFVELTGKNIDIPTITSSYMSPEGVVDMTSLLLKHFESYDFQYGKSSSFIIYFWVPREIWPDKPTMLGHWFIRQYRSGFSEGHSASFGFTGDLFVDFGYFSLVVIFFIGRLLRYGETFKNMALKNKGYIMILGAMLFPYVFFFVRSPLTSTMNFLGVLFVYFMIKRLIFIK